MTGNAFQRPYFFCHFTSFLYVCYLMKEKEFLCETRGFPNPTASGTNPMFLKKKGKTYYTGHLLLAHSPLRKKTQPQLLSNPNCYNSHLTDLQECNYLSLSVSFSVSLSLSPLKEKGTLALKSAQQLFLQNLDHQQTFITFSGILCQ